MHAVILRYPTWYRVSLLKFGSLDGVANLPSQIHSTGEIFCCHQRATLSALTRVIRSLLRLSFDALPYYSDNNCHFQKPPFIIDEHNIRCIWMIAKKLAVTYDITIYNVGPLIYLYLNWYLNLLGYQSSCLKWHCLHMSVYIQFSSSLVFYFC